MMKLFKAKLAKEYPEYICKDCKSGFDLVSTTGLCCVTNAYGSITCPGCNKVWWISKGTTVIRVIAESDEECNRIALEKGS